jgi:L-alanine-DL-glutamate epimerase-like enolase superfamily enzyme
MKLLLEVLYWAYKIKQPQFKAAMSGLEFALFDFYSKILKMPLTQFIFGN